MRLVFLNQLGGANMANVGARNRGCNCDDSLLFFFLLLVLIFEGNFFDCRRRY